MTSSMDVDYGFSLDEEAAFEELKKRFSGYLEENDENDFRLYRFLKDRNYNVDKAEVKLKNHLEFRQKMKLDSVLEDYTPKEPLVSYYPLNYLAFDVDVPLVMLLDGGNCDIIGILKSVKKADFIKYAIFNMEYVQRKLLEQTVKHKRPAGAYVITDMTNFAFSAMSNKTVIETSIEVLLIFDAHYPEILTAGYVINVPTFFSYGYNIVKRALSDKSLQKVTVHGKGEWRPEILESVSSEIFPAYLGGEKTDPDGNRECLATLIRGKVVPKHYYLRIPDYQLRNHVDVKRYSLKPRSKTNITHKVEKPGSLIEWQFESEGHDIGFGIFFKLVDNEDPRELIPIQRVSANLQREIGTIMVEEPGIYILVLDNSYSWVRGKHIFIRSSVKKPQEPMKREN